MPKIIFTGGKIMYLLEKRDRVLTLPALENRMALLEEEVREAERDLSKLLRQYKKESRNVERLEKESFSTLLLRLVGKLEDKLDETKLQEINAKLAYDSAAIHLNSLTEEKRELASRITPLKAEEKTYHAELKNRHAKIAQQLTEPQGIRYTELESERCAIISQITKIEEALRVAALAGSTAQKIDIFLDEVKGWSTYEISRWEGITSMEKHMRFHTLSSQLRELEYELRHIHSLEIPSLNEILLSTQSPLDFRSFFSFTGFSVSVRVGKFRDQVQESTQKISQLLNNLSVLEAALKSKMKEQEDKYTQNRRDEEELLLSM